MKKIISSPISLAQYLLPLSNARVFLGPDREATYLLKERIRHYIHYIQLSLEVVTRETGHERHRQEKAGALSTEIRSFLTEMAQLIAAEWISESLSHEMRRTVQDFFQENIIQALFSKLPEKRDGISNRITCQSIMGNEKLRAISEILNLSDGNIRIKLIELLKRDIERVFYLPTPLLEGISRDQFLDNLRVTTERTRIQNSGIEQAISRSLTPQDKFAYRAYKLLSGNSFFSIGESLFLAVEKASRDERLRNIPGNVPLSPVVAMVFAKIAGCLYLCSTFSQFGLWGTVGLSLLNQLLNDLEWLTWIGSRFGKNTEESLKGIHSEYRGFSLKDVAQICTVTAQVLMEFGNQSNGTILRMILGGFLVLNLASSATKIVTNKTGGTSHLTPLVGICVFFAAMRMLSYGLNFFITYLSLLYDSYDLYYGAKSPHEVLLTQRLCEARPTECRAVAFSTLNLPADAGRDKIWKAYREQMMAARLGNNEKEMARLKATKGMLLTASPLPSDVPGSEFLPV